LARALPPRRFYGLGVFLVGPSSRSPAVKRELAIFPRGVRPSSELRELRLRPHVPRRSRPLSESAPRNRAPRESPPSGPAGLPLLRFLAPERHYAGCPFSDTIFLSVDRVGRGSPDPRRCRPQGSCPSRRIWLARGSHRGLLDPADRRGPRRFADCAPRRRLPPAERPFPARVLGAPLQSFPFPGSRTRSRRPLLPCGFASDRRRRSACRIFTTAFTRRASPSPHAPARRQTRDSWAGTWGSPRSLVRSPRHTGVCRTCRPHPTYAGLAGKRPARPLRSFAPPGSPFRDDLSTWPG
jgi:hypothetical protein